LNLDDNQDLTPAELGGAAIGADHQADEAAR
jgi:hypothetical protein